VVVAVVVAVVVVVVVVVVMVVVVVVVVVVGFFVRPFAGLLHASTSPPVPPWSLKSASSSLMDALGIGCSPCAVFRNFVIGFLGITAPSTLCNPTCFPDVPAPFFYCRSQRCTPQQKKKKTCVFWVTSPTSTHRQLCPVRFTLAFSLVLPGSGDNVLPGRTSE
jgi:hypothetical protein